jgi:hypothetical protein
MASNDNSDKTIERAIPLRWPLENDLPHLYVNHFAYIDTGQEVIIVAGSLLPTGFWNRSDEEVGEFLDNATVKPLAKLVMTRGGATALLRLLKSQLEEPENESNE